MIKYFIYLTIGLLLLGCKAIVQSTDKNNLEVTKVDCEQYWLEHRISDCESALNFMKAIIDPGEQSMKLVNTNGKNYIGKIDIKIIGDNNPKRMKGLNKFYINLTCFKSLEVNEIISILCNSKDTQGINDIVKSPNYRIAFDVCIEGMECFSLVIFNNKIIEISWHLNVDSN